MPQGTLINTSSKRTKRNGKYKLYIREKTWTDYKCQEKVYRIISKCSKQAQKVYNTRHDWLRKVIHLELYEIKI